MPIRNRKLRVQDILEAIEGAREYVAGMSFEDFLKDDFYGEWNYNIKPNTPHNVIVI